MLTVKITPYRSTLIYQKASYAPLSKRCVMLKNADSKHFSEINIVCAYTDLRCGAAPPLAAIIERRCRMKLFVPNTLFLICGRSSSKIKEPFGKAMFSCFSTSVWKVDISHVHVTIRNSVP